MQFKGFSSLLSKMTAIFVLLTILPAMVIGIVANHKANTLLDHSVQNTQAGKAMMVAGRLDQYLQDGRASIAALAQNPFVFQLGSQEQTAVMKSFYDGNGMFELIFCVNTQGIIQNSWPPTNFGGKTNFTDRQWFKDVTGAKQPIMSDTYVSAFTKQATAPIVAPIIDANGQVLGYIGGNLKLDNVTALAKQLNEGETGKAVVLDKKLFYITDSRDDEKAKNHELLSDQQLMAIIQTQAAAVTTLDKTLVSYVPIGDTGWSVLKLQHTDETMQNANDLRNLILAVIGGSALLLGLIGFYYVRRICKPVTAITGIAEEIAQGRLMKTAVVYDGEDELRRLIVAFDTMTENLGSLLQQTSHSASLVASSTELLSANAEQSAQASNQIAVAINGVAEGSERQMNSVEHTVAVVTQMTRELNQMVSHIQAVTHTFQQTTQAAKTGNDEMIAAVEQMKKVEATVEHLAQVIQQLGEQSQTIEQIISTIAGIADQTNLLALNAAIEAARAGEQGRGFAVVAEEVRKLAEQSGQSAQQIDELIRAIQRDTQQAIIAMGQGSEQVKIGSTRVESTGQAFEQIVRLIESASREVMQVSDAMRVIEAKDQEIVTAIQQIEHISKENGLHTQAVSAATEEQTAAMQEIVFSSKQLEATVEELGHIVSRFKL
jgi:methyl-accepting chemotaxis protein